ncbi:sodium:solute symporter family protein [Limibacter armeniacum]|uniref:sodium:solute symporter family protein n=1 Tax=Limibacter armeniacum TaxID=466084 RepID=UPI002FE5CB12
MHFLDMIIFFAYMVAMLGVGFYFLKQNKTTDDYYVGGRSMSSWHIGLSVVATDVGGGFSIGLGGLGFAMGLSGSWMLFTGLAGAWLAAVFLIPKVSRLSKEINLLTFPQLFGFLFDGKTALLAGIISAVGYLGFTSSQILAGAKLASATFPELSIESALWVMGGIAVIYTVFGGLKAVIYTDTVQWIILMVGLIFVAIPMAYIAVGGYDTIVSTLPASFFEFGNLEWQTFVNWSVTIIPIWFVGMTLYQRIYAAKNEHEAQKAWFIAGIFEWPIMAFMGVLLGLLARVAMVQGILGDAAATAMADEEMGLPLLLKSILPAGLMGVVMAAYFSAIMSTADSCLMAASGNLMTDIVGRFIKTSEKNVLKLSQFFTFLIGFVAIIIATYMKNVLELMLMSYSVMVSGLFIPLLAGMFITKKTSIGAFWAMVVGGSVTVTLIATGWKPPYGLDANIIGITSSAFIYFLIGIFHSDKRKPTEVLV